MSSERELDEGIKSIKSAWRREHTARDNLEKMLEQAEAENAKLREELEQWHRLTAGIELPEYPITEFKPKDIERENAKLRELCEEMLIYIAYPYVCVRPSVLVERAHELGIEVE